MGSCCADGVLRAAELGPCTLPMYYISQEHMARALGKAAGWVAAASQGGPHDPQARPCIAAPGRQAAVVRTSVTNNILGATRCSSWASLG